MSMTTLYLYETLTYTHTYTNTYRIYDTTYINNINNIIITKVIRFKNRCKKVRNGSWDEEFLTRSQKKFKQSCTFAYPLFSKFFFGLNQTFSSHDDLPGLKIFL